MKETQVIKTFVNESGQVVAMDSNGSWKVYNPKTQSFGAYAKGPTIETAEPALPGIIPGKPIVTPGASTSTLNKDEEDRLRRMIVEKDTVIADKDREVHDRDAEILRRDDTIRKLHQELETEKNTPRADPTEIERLKRKISDLTLEYNDATKAAQEEAARKLADKDREITDLKVKAATPPPAPAPVMAATLSAATLMRTAFTKYKKPTWIAVAATVLVLIFAAYGWQKFWYPTYVPSQVVTAPAEIESLRSTVADLSSKEMERQRAEKELAKKLKNMQPLAPLKPFRSN
jgi:hypothetical protein